MATIQPRASAPSADFQDPFSGYAPAPSYAPGPPAGWDAPALPPGWEMRCTPEGQPYYIDHTSQQTFWASPGGPSPPAGALYPNLTPTSAPAPAPAPVPVPPAQQYHYQEYQAPPPAFHHHAPPPVAHPPAQPIAPMVVSLQQAPASHSHRPAPAVPAPAAAPKTHVHTFKKKTYSVFNPSVCNACSHVILGKVGYRCGCGSNFHLECGKKLPHR